jgi:hypothetical protein
MPFGIPDAWLPDMLTPSNPQSIWYSLRVT